MERWEIDSDSSLLPIIEKAGSETIDVTRDGEVIAQIIPSPRHDRAAASAAVKKLLSLQIDLKLAPGETIKDLIVAGRKY
jgi:antitoxin (DNA-binding transcriptional repressor) of toxin-antitoxin stability system